MYSFLFVYADDGAVRINHVEAAEYDYDTNGRTKVEGPDILKHFFPFNRSYMLRTSNGTATVSGNNLRYIEVTAET